MPERKNRAGFGASMVDRRFTKSRHGTARPAPAQSGRLRSIVTSPYREGHSRGMGTAMTQPSQRGSRAGGAIIAFTVVAGALIGNHYSQPSLGTVIGTGVGVTIALLLYIIDRRRA